MYQAWQYVPVPVTTSRAAGRGLADAEVGEKLAVGGGVIVTAARTDGEAGDAGGGSGVAHADATAAAPQTSAATLQRIMPA